MSCSDNKTLATSRFNSASYSASAFDIGLLEETQSTDNTCTLTGVRGKVRIDLSAFPTGSCIVYFNVTPQTDGSSNAPPCTADSLFHPVLTATMGIVNTSDYYANTTPTFSGSNDCLSADKQLGWNLVDQTGAVKPNFQYNV